MYYGTQEHEGAIVPDMMSESDLTKYRNALVAAGYEQLDIGRGGEEGLQPHELEVWAHETEPDITIVCLDASQQLVDLTRRRGTTPTRKHRRRYKGTQVV